MEGASGGGAEAAEHGGAYALVEGLDLAALGADEALEAELGDGGAGVIIGA